MVFAWALILLVIATVAFHFASLYGLFGDPSTRLPGVSTEEASSALATVRRSKAPAEPRS